MFNKIKIKTNDNSYYIFGTHASIAALNNPSRKIMHVYCTQTCFKFISTLIQKYQYKIVTSQFLQQLLGKEISHQGIAIKAYPLTINRIENLNLIDKNYKIVILDQLSDPYNLGSIIRSAVAFNISTIILPKDNSFKENGIIAKIAVGTLEKINLVKVINLCSTIQFLKKHGFWIIGLDSHSSNIINSKILNGKIALVFGSESKGIRKLTQQQCDFLAKIPMSK